MNLSIIEPELEGRIQEWWDGIKIFHEPSKTKSALVRLDPGHYVLCVPQEIDADAARKLIDRWKHFNEEGPKLMVFSNTIFVPRLEGHDGDQG